jgi:hypothetical protein
MSLPQISLEWLLIGCTGWGLALFSSQFIFPAARQLRRLFWLSIILFGESAVVPLRVLSICFGLCASLPLWATLFSIPAEGSALQLSSVQFWIVGLTLFFRIFLWPALALDWSTVRKWEQEVVRRPRGGLWAYIFAPNHPARRLSVSRAAELGRVLARTELINSSSLRAIPRQSLGLLLIYLMTLSISPANAHLKAESQLLFIVMSGIVFFERLILGIEAKRRIQSLILWSLIPLALVLSTRIFTNLQPSLPWPDFIFSKFTHDLSQFSLVTVVFFLVWQDFKRLLDAQRSAGVDLGSAPVDKRYSVLKKITQTAQWVANPKHFVSILMQFDVLLTTLKISAS